MTDMTRSYTRVTPDMEAEVIAARRRLGAVGYADIADDTGMPERTVRYILTDLPRLRRSNSGEAKADGSLKTRIYMTIRELGQVKDVAELRQILGMADDEHDVLHVLHALHTQGRIDFTERGNGMGTATVINIHLPKKGGPKVEVEPEATTEEPHAPLPSAPEPEEEGYPLFDALLERERSRLDNDNKGMAYVTAAEAIEKIDPEAARDLMRRAEGLNVPFPSPIEREFLRYVAANPERKS